jgi:hypothetical protein
MNDFLEFHATPVFRSTLSALDEVQFTPSGRRPRRVPLVVDNIWEFVRPSDAPSRRTCAFGSPTAELALASGPAGAAVGRVFVTDPCKILQLSDVSDARDHPDVTTILEIRRRSSPDDPGWARLDSELLEAFEVGEQLVSVGAIEAVRRRARLWQDCIPVPARGLVAPDPVGEIFFSAPRGYIVSSSNGANAYLRNVAIE